ncbi:ABC transporter permease [Gemmata sp.]|uniref:ABC transporter permease n=1 Tax=Gemmata sp. TaxID=1914242 RepID=UPI003F72E3BF
MAPGHPLARLMAAARNRPALAVLVAACAAAAVRYETFLTPENLTNVLRQNSMAGLLALGMGLAILSGGLDLSLGALLAVGAVVAATLSPHGAAAAVAGAVAAAGALGVVNGLLVAVARVQPFIATLAVNMAARGALLAWTAEQSVRVARDAADLNWLGRGWVGPVPVPVLVLFAAFALAGVVLGRTRFGRHVYAVGDSEEAARLLGLNVGRVRVGVYALSGALAGLAGAVLAARVGVGQPTAGLGWELAAITAFVLGATSLGGRPAGAGSTLVGVLLLAVVFNAFNLEGSISSSWQWVLRGAILIGVVALQHRIGRPPG